MKNKAMKRIILVMVALLPLGLMGQSVTGGSVSNCLWKISKGTYDFTVDLTTMSVREQGNGNLIIQDRYTNSLKLTAADLAVLGVADIDAVMGLKCAPGSVSVPGGLDVSNAAGTQLDVKTQGTDEVRIVEPNDGSLDVNFANPTDGGAAGGGLNEYTGVQNFAANTFRSVVVLNVGTADGTISKNGGTAVPFKVGQSYAFVTYEYNGQYVYNPSINIDATGTQFIVDTTPK